MVVQLEEIDGIKVIELKEFLFDKKQVQSSRQRFNGENSIAFIEDLESGKLKDYEGTFVAYRRSVFCGQSKNKNSLYVAAVRNYGVDDLAVFEVPKEPEEPDFRKAMGIYLIPSKFLHKYLAELPKAL